MPTPPMSQPVIGAAQQAGGPSEFTRVLGAQRAPSAPAKVPGGPPSPTPAEAGVPRKSYVPLIIAGAVLLIVLAAVIVLVLVTRK